MDRKRQLDITVNKTIEAEMTGYHAGYDMWNWIQGVGVVAILKAYGKNGEEVYYEFVKKWVDYHLESGLPEININTTIPMLAVLEIYKKTGDPKYRALCKQYADHCMAEAPRTNEGAFEHTVLANKWKQQIWADTLFMGAHFLAKWGDFVGEDLYIKEAARQMILHIKYLVDPEDGLMYHGYDCIADDHMSGVKWGRANGWHFLSAIEILEVMPAYFEEKPLIIANMKAHVDAMLKYQQPSGLWCTVVDDADTYEEMTVTCCVHYGLAMGIAKGYLDEGYLEVAIKAFSAIEAHISDDGQFMKTSGPTPVLDSAKDYDEVPCTLSYYGQGIGIMSLLAQMTLEETGISQ